jgi:hypothetical protein
MSIAQWQYAFRDVVWGEGTDVIVQTVTGLDLPPIRSNDQAKSGAHGDFSGVDTLGPRQIVFTVEIAVNAGESIEDVLGPLKEAFMPGDPSWQTVEPFTFWEPPNPALTVFCKPRGLTYPKDRRYVHGIVTAVMGLYAPDPLLYGDEESISVPMFREAGGFTMPLRFPMVFAGAGAEGDTVVTNTGRRSTYPRTSFYGPAEQPYIENATTGEILELDMNLSSNDVVAVDHASPHSVLLNGVASVRGAVSAASSFFALQSGPTHLRLRTRGIGSGSATVTWRPAQL